MDTTSTAAKIRRRVWTTLAVGTSVFCSMTTLMLASTSANTPAWNHGIGFVINLAAAVMLIWRYRYPWHTLAVAVTGPLFLETDGTAALIALFAITAFARGRKLLGAAVIVYLACGVSLSYDAFRRRDYSVLTMGVRGESDGLSVPEWNVPLWIPWLVAAVLVALVVGFGLLRKTQSDLAVAEFGRAKATEETVAMREEMVRAAERARIARDMHDTLAASLTRVSLFAGGLQVNSTEGPEKIANTASLIRDTAHDALDELKRIIGVLRGGNDPDATGMVRSIAGIPDLVQAARSAGAHVTLFVDLMPGEPGAIASHVAYRVVQESITNAQKHAPGAAVSVSLTGASESGIRVDVRNPIPPQPQFAPGSRTGLQGLTEQVRSVGGTFDAREWPGLFVVQAWLPWHA